MADALARIELAGKYPIIQLVWAVILKYMEWKEFGYGDFKERGFSEAHVCAALDWLQTWGRIESAGQGNFRVCKRGSIIEHDPFRAATALLST